MPSIAITKADVGHTSFGDISLVFDKESINPTDKRNKVYGEDAWTPTFPSVGYKLNSDKTRDIYNRANKVGELPLFNPVHFHPTNYENRIDDRGDTSLVENFKEDYDAKQLYLSETGNAVKEFEQHEVEKYDSKDVALFEKMLGEIGIERLKSGDYDDLKGEMKQLINQHYGIDLDSRKPFVAKAKIQNRITHAIDYAENGNKETKIDIEATKAKIDERIDNKEFEQWLKGLFSGVVEKRGIRNDRDWYTSSGNRRKWEQLYDEITLDNVVNVMRKQAAKGGEGLFGGNIFGSAQEEYKSIDEIRDAARERIRHIDESDYQKQRDAITDRLSAIEIPGAGSNFSDTMDMVQNIQDAVAHTHTAPGIHKYLKKFYPKITMETAHEIADIVKDIQHLSARYFEAKPYRAVGFDEVKLAVVPSDTDAGLIERLKQEGIEVRTYEKGNQSERKQIVDEATEEMRLRFQLIGEKGAAALDKAEEATTRLDNLNVAREMEQAFNEKKKRVEKLRKSEPVEITGKEIEPSDDLKQYKKNALEYGKSLRGEYINKDTGETVMVGKNAIKEVLNHDYKDLEQLQSIAAIPQIIENAVYIESQANIDDKV
ncbi:phage associated protein, partial [gut metagenome]